MKTSRSRAGVVQVAVGMTALLAAACATPSERPEQAELAAPAEPSAAPQDYAARAAAAQVCDRSDGVISDLALLDPAPSQSLLADDAQPLLDPIPEDPTPTDLGLVLEEFTQFPKSEPFPPTTDARLVRWARINFIGDVPDGSGRMYTPDLNGTLYMVKQRTPDPYLD